MGSAYFIVLERKIDGLDTLMDGKRLSQTAESLDAVASRLGVKPLSEFISIDPEQAAELMEMDISDIKITLQQFSAQDGLATMRALLPLPEAQPAIHDLKDCVRILSVAAEHGVGWHFEIDI